MTGAEQALLWVGGAVVTVAGSWFVARYTAQAGKHAAETTAKVQEKADAIDGMDRLVKNLESRLSKVEEEAASLKNRVYDLERQRRKDRSLIRALYDYAARMRAALRAASLPVPDPPAGIDLDEPLPS